MSGRERREIDDDNDNDNNGSDNDDEDNDNDTNDNDDDINKGDNANNDDDVVGSWKLEQPRKKKKHFYGTIGDSIERKNVSENF